MLEAQDQIRRFQDFFEEVYKTKIVESVSRGKNFVLLDFSDLTKFDPDLAEDLLNSPEETLKAAEMAVEQLDIVQSNFRLRLTNLPISSEMMIRDIRSTHLGKLYSFEGIVRQKSDVRPQVIASRFECPACGQVIAVLQVDTNFREPTKCGCGRKGRFNLLSKDLVDAQGIVLEESPDVLEGSAQPKRINVFLKEDLVSPISEKRTNPGSKIRVIGLVKDVPFVLKTGGKSTRFDLLVEANNVEAVEESFYDIVVTAEEEAQIKELSQDPRIYEKMIGSIAPSIYGYVRTKESLILQLMGGVQKKRTDGVVSRGDIHILLVGDPGSGKSQLLKRVSSIAPKGRYVSGKGVSGAGLTAAVVRDEFLGGWSLEAGALVLANNGICCIDEMDKMSTEDRAAMHEALEQQSYHPDSEIMLADGTTHKIGTLVDNLFDVYSKDKIIGKDCEILPVNTIEVLSTDFNKIAPINVNRVSRHTAPEYFIEIEYSNGRKITVTPEHPIFVFKKGVKEIPAETVKINDLAFAPRRLPIKESRNISKEMARFLGYLASEGHTYRNKKNRYAEIGISNTNKKIIDECISLFESVFGIKANVNIQKVETRKKATIDLTTVRISSNTAYDYLKNEFPEIIGKAPVKRVPNKLKSASEICRKEFLRAAFRGDGFVDSERFGFSTASFNLAKDYQDLLLSLDIWSYIADEKRGAKNYYKVVISSTASMDLFKEIIVENDDLRLERIESFCIRSASKKNYHDPVPTEIVKRVDALLSKLALNKGYFHKILKKKQNSNREVIKQNLERVKTKLAECLEAVKSSPINELRVRANVPVRTIAHTMNVSSGTVYNMENATHLQHTQALITTKNIVAEKIQSIENELADLSHIINSDIKLITVKSVKRVENEGVKWVYDVTVEPTRTFISEGLVLHNTVSISKANIQATLLARTTVLAAANPHFGRFDPYGVIAEQINLPPTLINRFDLIFPIKDMPDEGRDERMAKHILNLHQTPDVGESEISTDLLKKYVVYARQNVFPKLTDGALNEIKDFYVKMRNRGSQDERAVRAVPISARQLEALVRLSEASARVRLSDRVTKKDARRAIELLTYCLLQIGVDKETGMIDIDRITTGIPASQRDKIFTIKEVITELESKLGKVIPSEEIAKAVASRGITESEVEEVIEKLKRSGDIYEPRHGFIQKL